VAKSPQLTHLKYQSSQSNSQMSGAQKIKKNTMKILIK